jgi:hypothetical protein
MHDEPTYEKLEQKKVDNTIQDKNRMSLTLGSSNELLITNVTVAIPVAPHLTGRQHIT